MTAWVMIPTATARAGSGVTPQVAMIHARRATLWGSAAIPCWLTRGATDDAQVYPGTPKG